MKVNLLTFLSILFVAILLFIAFPFGMIWAINHLFAMSIGYGFFDWLAVTVLWVSLSAACKASISK